MKHKEYLSSFLEDNTNKIQYVYKDIETGKEVDNEKALEIGSAFLADHYYIGSKLSILKGKILTLVDASLPADTVAQQEQKKAIKDIINSIVSSEIRRISSVMGHQ